MQNLRSYQELKKIKEIYFVDYNENNAREILKQNLVNLSKTLEQEFKNLFDNTLIIKDSLIYFDDSDFRQGATAYIFKATLKEDENYRISIECLVDYGKIGVTSMNEPENHNLISFHQKIQAKANGEGFSELNNFLK